MTMMTVREGQRFAMPDFFGREHDCWQVAHTVLMPPGRQRTTVLNQRRPGDTLDIYADELLDPARFIALDARQHTAPATCAQLAA